MKTYREWRWKYTSTYFNLDARQRLLASSRPGRFTSGKELLHPLDRRLGGPQIRCARGGEEKNILTPAGNRNPAIQPLA